MKAKLIVFFLSVTSLAMSQTRLINHKSHSGSAANFSRSLTKTMFNRGESNFGQAPQRHVRNSKLDSVILLSEKVAVMITSESCHYEDFDGRDQSKPYLWSAGKDTVYEHEVFNSGKSVEEIKKILKKEYYFANSIDEVVFLGFDGKYVEEKKKEESKKSIAPKVSKRERNLQNEELIHPSKKRPDSIFTLFFLSLLSVLFRGSL